MSVKTILVAASGGTASDGAIETACRIAERLGAHVEALHVKPDPTQVIAMAADGFSMPVAGDWIDRLIADSDALAAETKKKFAAAAERHGLPMAATPHTPAGATWRVETGYGPIMVAERARFFDLVVLGRSERVVDRPHSDAIEETLVRSGRPVLLAPADPPAAIGAHIALGWNGSAEAVHVMAAAMPLLERAGAVTVISIGDEDSALPLIDYLALHRVAATHRRVAPVKGVGPGEQLLSEAREAGADLLMMGAYGHRPWREIMFGGATREVVSHSLLPVLLSH